MCIVGTDCLSFSSHSTNAAPYFACCSGEAAESHLTVVILQMLKFHMSCAEEPDVLRAEK